MKIINKLENGRAAFAYKCAEEIASDNKSDNKREKNKKREYKAYVKKIPMFIKTNGLGATMAFIKSKGGTYKIIYEQISKWFKEEENPLKLNAEDFVKEICNMDSQQYKAITNETLAFLNWLRRFADGLIEEDSK